MNGNDNFSAADLRDGLHRRFWQTPHCPVCGESFSEARKRALRFTVNDPVSGFSIDTDSIFCEECQPWIKIQFLPKLETICGIPAISLFDYHSDAIARVLMHIKCEKCRFCQRFFAAVYAAVLDELQKRIGQNDRSAIVPLPRNAYNRACYGFDQMSCIAHEIHRQRPAYTVIKLYDRLPLAIKAQKTLSHALRKIAAQTMILRNARPKLLPSEKTILFLLDDICSSGETAKRAASLLLRETAADSYSYSYSDSDSALVPLAFVFFARPHPQKEPKRFEPIF